MRKVIQIMPVGTVGFVVLCDDGTMWEMYSNRVWKQVPNVPQDSLK